MSETGTLREFYGCCSQCKEDTRNQAEEEDDKGANCALNVNIIRFVELYDRDRNISNNNTIKLFLPCHQSIHLYSPSYDHSPPHSLCNTHNRE